MQNIIKKSKGFNWGPSAVSTTYWTGVRLCDLLRYCGVRRPSQGAKHVVFAGIEKELPQVCFPLSFSRQLQAVRRVCLGTCRGTAACGSADMECIRRFLLALRRS